MGTAAGVQGAGADGMTVHCPPGGGNIVFDMLAIVFLFPFPGEEVTFSFRLPVQNGQLNSVASLTRLPMGSIII